MKVTHVFYDDPALSRVFLQKVLTILDPSTAHLLSDFTEELENDSTVVLLLSLKKQSLDFHPIPFLKQVRDTFPNARTAILFVGSAFSLSYEFLEKIAAFSWNDLAYADYVDANDLKHPEETDQKLINLKRSLYENIETAPRYLEQGWL